MIPVCVANPSLTTWRVRLRGIFHLSRLAIQRAIALGAPGASKAGPGAGGGQEPETPALADGTIKDSRIWLKGKAYRLTQGLRILLSYLLANHGVSEDAVIAHCAFSSSSHLHKRLKDLRDQLDQELKRSGWRLQIKTNDTHVYWQWREAN
jgi:hypothetical protein